MKLVARDSILVPDPNSVLIRGYAAIFGNEFDYFDPIEWRKRRLVVDSGAFSGILDWLGSQSLDVYWNHQSHRLQLGETSVLRQDDRGLYYEAQPFATSEAIDHLTVMAGRARTGASFAFDFGEIAEDDDGVEHLLSFSAIYEVGPTPIGANPLAYSELVDIEVASEAESEPIPEPAAEASAAFWQEISKFSQIQRVRRIENEGY